MNRILPFSIALLLLVCVPRVSHAAPSSRIDQANSALRYEVKQGMLEGAARHGAQIHTDSFAFVSRGDGVLASTTVTAFDTLTEETLSRGTFVGFIYVSGFGIVPGFYRVFVIANKGAAASSGYAYLLDEMNWVRKIAPMVINRTPRPPEQMNTVSANEDGTSTIDYHKVVESGAMPQAIGLVIKL